MSTDDHGTDVDLLDLMELIDPDADIPCKGADGPARWLLRTRCPHCKLPGHAVLCHDHAEAFNDASAEPGAGGRCLQCRRSAPWAWLIVGVDPIGAAA